MLRALKLYDNAPPAQFFYQAFHAIEQWQIEEKDEQTNRERIPEKGWGICPNIPPFM